MQPSKELVLLVLAIISQQQWWLCSDSNLDIINKWLSPRYDIILMENNLLRSFLLVRDVRSGSGVTRIGTELLRDGRELTTKVGEQPWPQLVRCASIYCRACGCIFQEDWIVARSLREEWCRLVGMRIGQGKDVNDFNLRTKGLGCNCWSTYTKSGIGGVQVISLHRDPIGVDNRSLGSKN